MMSERPETAGMEFDGDWCGVFIRGDWALYYAQQLNLALEMLKGQDEAFLESTLKGLLGLLSSCNQQAADPDRQLMKNWKECKR
jgi:hypothetical protein